MTEITVETAAKRAAIVAIEETAKRAAVVAMAAATVSSLVLTAMYMGAERVSPLVGNVAWVVVVVAMSVAVLATIVAGSAAVRMLEDALSIGMRLPRATEAKKIATNAKLTPLVVPIRVSVLAWLITGLTAALTAPVGTLVWVVVGIAAGVAALRELLVPLAIKWVVANIGLETPRLKIIDPMLAALVAALTEIIMHEIKHIGIPIPIWIKIGPVTMIAGKMAYTAVKAAKALTIAAWEQSKGKGCDDSQRYRDLIWDFEITLPNGWVALPRLHQVNGQPEFVSCGEPRFTIKFAVGPVAPSTSVDEQKLNLQTFAREYGYDIIEIGYIQVGGKEHATMVYWGPKFGTRKCYSLIFDGIEYYAMAWGDFSVIDSIVSSFRGASLSLG